MRRHLVPFLVLSCVVTAAARAQVPAPATSQPGPVAEAAALAAQAEKDARARKFDAAVEGFKRAYALSPDPAYLYNVGVLSLVGLKDAAQAWEFAMQYAERARSPAEQADANDLIAKAEAALAETHGRIEVRVTPDAAEVHLDRRTPDARLKRKVAWVAPGLHNLYATAPGHAPGEVQVTVKVGVKSEVVLALQPEHARLRVESRTPEAVIFVDARPAGPAPAERTVPPGEHVVRAEAVGYRPFEQTVRLGPGETLVVHADLAAVGAPGARTSGGTVSKGASPLKTWGWVSIGTGAALAATGGVLYGLAYKDYQDASDIPPGPENDARYDSKVSQGRKKAIGAYVTWGLSGAAIATGVVLLVVKPGGGTALVPAGPDGNAGLTATFSW